MISLESWPVADERKINEKIEETEKAVEKTISDILNILKILKERKEEPKKIYLYIIPNEKEFYNIDILEKRVGKEVKIYAVNDKEKHDPQNFSKKAKPGRPAIFCE